MKPNSHVQVCTLLEHKASRLCSKKNYKEPKVPNYEIQGAQHKAYMKEIRLSGRPKAKVSRLRHPGALRACND